MGPLPSTETGKSLNWIGEMPDARVAAPPTAVDVTFAAAIRVEPLPAPQAPNAPSPPLPVAGLVALSPALGFPLSEAVDLVRSNDEPLPLAVIPPGAAQGPAGQGSAGLQPTIAAQPHLVEAMVALVAGQNDGSTEIALAPEELGKVRLQVQTDVQNPDRLVVVMTFERAETLDLFRRHAADLTESLRAAGYGEARLDFGQQGTATGSGAGQGAAPGPEGGANKSDPPGPRPDESASAPRPAATGTLDLRL
jgi:hypothetical protein